MDNGYKIYCSRCGAEMNSNSRYCMKCGNLNYDHAANESMKNIMNPKEDVYQIGSGQFVINNDKGDAKQTIATETGNKIVCFILNYLLFIAVMGLSFWYCTNGSFQLKTIAHSFFPLVAIIISIFFLYFYSLQLVFMKCNKRWWIALIPIYNMLELSHIIFNKRWIGLLTFIPVVGFFVYLVMLYKLGTYFNYNGVLVVLFPFVFIPLIGFGVHPYRGYVFVDDQSWMTLEREYRFKKVYFFSLVLFFVIGIVCIGTTNFSYIEETFNKINNYYYVYLSKKFVSRVKGKIEVENYDCEIDFEKTTNVYFYYVDLRKAIYVPFSLLHEIVGGYVRVDKSGEEYEYYISIGDGQKGFSEVNIKDLSLDTVVDYTEIPRVDSGKNVCKFIY